MLILKYIKRKSKKLRIKKPKASLVSRRIGKLMMIMTMIMVFVLSPYFYSQALKNTAATTVWLKDIYEFDEYPHFEQIGINIPRKYNVHGIDVSYYQDKIDWQMVKDMHYQGIEISFAFIKATEGVSWVDPYFKRNWRESKNAGVVRGAYHFFIPNKSPKWQAKFFYSTITIEPGDLPPVVDIEKTKGLSKKELKASLKEFLIEFERLSGVRPIIYTGSSFFKTYLEDDFNDYPIWVAHYRTEKLANDIDWDFWQHADNARIEGIYGRVDMDIYNGEFTQLDSLRIK